MVNQLPAEGSVVVSDLDEFAKVYGRFTDLGYTTVSGKETEATVAQYWIPLWFALVVSVVTPPIGLALLVLRRYSRREVRISLSDDTTR